MAPLSQDLATVSRLLRDRDFTSARSRLEALLLHSPDDISLLSLYAETLIRQEDAQRAQPLLKRLLELRPRHPRLLCLAADGHRLSGHEEDATRLYLASLEEKEDDYARSRAIDGLIHQERFLEAGRLLEEGLKKNPQDIYLLRRKARLLAATDKKDQAAVLLSSLSRENANPRDYAEALRLRLEALPASDRRPEVEKLLSLSSHQRNPWLHALVGELALAEGDTQSAHRALVQATSVGKSDPAVLKSIGFLFNRLEAFPEVLETLGEAFIHDPRDVVSQQVLFSAARKAKDFGRLKLIFSRAYEAHPGFHKLNGLIKKAERLEAASIPL